MKLSKQQLKQLIKEELQNVLNEQGPKKWPVPQNWIAADRKKQPQLDIIKSMQWYREGTMLYSNPDRSGYELQIGVSDKSSYSLCDQSWDKPLFPNNNNFCVEVKT